MARRKALANSPRVIKAVDAFFLMLTHDQDKRFAIDRDKYTYFHVRVQKAMAPEFDLDAAIVSWGGGAGWRLGAA